MNRRWATTSALLQASVGPVAIDETAETPPPPGSTGWFREAVEAKVRGTWEQFDSSLVPHGAPTAIEDTHSQLHCHYIRSDNNGQLKLDVLAGQLAKQIVHFCIPRSSIAAAQAIADEDERMVETTRLALQAQKLFTRTQPNTGEGGELLLFTLLERYLGLPQIISKMSMKTNTEMQIHGSDSVHAKVLPDGKLALYWGEAKVYADLSSAMAACFDSITPFLLGNAAGQDVFLIEHYADLADPDLKARIIDYFDPDSPLSNELVVRGACLIGFPAVDYPELPARADELAEALNAEVADWNGRLKTRISNKQLKRVTMEIFFVPLPSADEFQAAIKRALGIAS